MRGSVSPDLFIKDLTLSQDTANPYTLFLHVVKGISTELKALFYSIYSELQFLEQPHFVA